MSRSAKLCVVGLILVTFLTVGLASVAFAQDDTVEFVVSPSTLNLESNGGVISLHVDIAYSAVTDVELEVDGQSTPIASTFPDSRGDLVVKCRLATVKEQVSVGEATFALTVYTQSATYSGVDTIKVIDQGK